LEKSECITDPILLVEDEPNVVVFLNLVDACALLEAHCELAVLEEDQKFGLS
jgi:hypothetical protein